MNTIGIICEYNPFHNGHIYHINKIKEKFPNSLIILVLNGYFTMRGEVSILSKSDKVSIALQNSIDLVIELPSIEGTNSADDFAYYSITILNYLKCDYIVFGSEINDIDVLTDVALKQDDEEISIKVKENLKKGLNYPTALSKALDTSINTPNDLLGISYIKAIKKLKSKIIPISIERTNNYHDLISNEHIVSASNIRNKIAKDESISNYLPTSSLTKIKTIDYDLLFNLIKYKIITDDNLNSILTVDEGIENRLRKYINSSSSLDEFINKIKTKRYTQNRIQRMLTHILLNITKEDKEKHKNIEYIKVLGFNKKGQKYLNSVKKSIDIPVSSKIGNEFIARKYEITASLIYDLITKSNTYEFECKNRPITK